MHKSLLKRTAQFERLLRGCSRRLFKSLGNWLARTTFGCLLFGVLALHASSSQATLIIQTNPFSSADQFGLSPFWDWKQIESKNFKLIFPTELESIAEKTIHYCEEAHALLSPLLRWQPHHKTIILLIDNEDAANGLTTPLGRFGIILWATPPDSWFSTSYYDNWLRLLVIHEYTHYLNMDTTLSFWDPLRYVFGASLLPNSAWAPWMLEGLAVYMETRFTQAGRGRSPFYQMVIRAAVDQGVLNSSQFVTLDKVNGSNPYYPGGDTRYQFGYHLMNQISLQKTSGLTADGKSSTSGGDDLLGLMSYRSGHRIPFFINGNLNNIVGKDWYSLWDEWTSEAKVKAQADLQKIASQPTTSFQYITSPDPKVSNEVMGSALSPDGQWLAYTSVSADRRPGLFLKNLQTGALRRINDKLYGVGMSFTPDSKALISSELNRAEIYYLYSDLHVYLLDRNSGHPLTDRLRARDPDVSQDGQWVTFTVSEKGLTYLAIASLISSDGDYRLGPITRLYVPAAYDRVANPRFSPDGKRIVFSLHVNGRSQEDLMEIDRTNQQLTPLVSNGKYNGFPAFNSKGDLFFISNATGVDNLYRFSSKDQPPELMTNMKTGIGFPTFSPAGKPSDLYASVFSYAGWNLAKVDLPHAPLDREKANIQPLPAPQVDSRPVHIESNFKTSDYSAFPSLLPRVWSPLLGADSNGVIAGGQVLGFDAVNRHRYLLAGTYASQLNVADGYLLYSNRSIGPSINFTTDILTTNVNTLANAIEFSRQLDFSASVAYPFLKTYSSWTPAVSFNLQKIFDYQQSLQTSEQSSLGSTLLVPNLSGSLSFSNLEYSRLAVTAEGGRFTQLGSRLYMKPDEPIWKLFFLDEEHLRIAQHTILIPSFKASWVSHVSSDYRSSNTVLSGRTLQQALDAFPGNGFNQLSIRGYPGLSYFSRAATVAALDLQFPISRLFSGWGTNPVFLDNLYGLVFAEASYFPYSTSNLVLPSAGSGLRLSTELFFLPITFSLEYHYGFNQQRGGASDLFFQVLASGLQF
jgi:Tol biopolymer transport system component